MSRPPLDLEGKRSGKLIAVRRMPPEPGAHSAMWECKCECGNTAYVAANELAKGSTRSCGCLRKDPAYKRSYVKSNDKTEKMKLMITSGMTLKQVAEKFGLTRQAIHDRLKKTCGGVTALRPDARKKRWTPEEDALLGTISDRELAERIGVCSDTVRERRVSKRIPKASQYEDLTGKKFSRLTVVRASRSFLGGRTAWFCECECGHTVIAMANNLKAGRQRSCGCLLRDEAKFRGDGTPWGEAVPPHHRRGADMPPDSPEETSESIKAVDTPCDLAVNSSKPDKTEECWD